jgi:hypothetical protein
MHQVVEQPFYFKLNVHSESAFIKRHKEHVPAESDSVQLTDQILSLKSNLFCGAY